MIHRKICNRKTYESACFSGEDEYTVESQNGSGPDDEYYEDAMSLSEDEEETTYLSGDVYVTESSSLSGDPSESGYISGDVHQATATSPESDSLCCS